MSSEPIAIAARGVTKRYWLRHRPKPTTLAESIAGFFRRPRSAAVREAFLALDGVSFEIQRGDVVGLIGRNGSGKSTLLKILSRITELSAGEVDMVGRVGSLLEVGTGFHQDLTGRENIFLNGAMLGMTKAEIVGQFDEIVAFAGVERFLDTAVKHYSSGMYVRLAFAVAAHLRSEILIVDEVLAVGDAEFQDKCLRKMREVSTDGRTVVFVSHNMHSIALLCSRTLVLDAGRVSFFGGTGEGVAAYTSQFAHDQPATVAPTQRRGTGEYRFDQVTPDKRIFQPHDRRRIAFTVRRSHDRLNRFYPSAHLFDAQGQEVAHMDGRFVGCWMTEAERLHGELVMNGPWLKPGRYFVDMYLCSESAVVDAFPQACMFEVSAVLPYPHSAGPIAVPSGSVLADYTWQATADVDSLAAPRT